MKKMRVMMLVHPEMEPLDHLSNPKDPEYLKRETEIDVKRALVKLGHEVNVVTVHDDLQPLRDAIEQWRPQIAFNLLEDFAGDGALDFYVVSYLDMAGIPFTGCNPRGMMLARDKALSKKILHFHDIKVPEFRIFPFGKKIKHTKLKDLPYPMIVKSNIEQGSVGISQASFVSNAKDLCQRVEQLQTMTQGDVIAEQYIDGRELYVGVMGNDRLAVLPIRELSFDDHASREQRIATYNVKWNDKYREKIGFKYGFAAGLSGGTRMKIEKLSRRIYRKLLLSGYARLDLRMAANGDVYVLEANPNAAITHDDDLALAAKKAGYAYPALIKRILQLGLCGKQQQGNR
ncbi:MAG: ATP-grasp domain-containing protein [Gammaproteobacteria bacterium]|nr:ATP-grasp domain-containing protein [Gammaproteobacteria bacterium]